MLIARFPASIIEDFNVVENAKCVNTSGLRIASEKLFSNYESVMIEFEHCISRNDTDIS